MVEIFPSFHPLKVNVASTYFFSGGLQRARVPPVIFICNILNIKSISFSQYDFFRRVELVATKVFGSAIYIFSSCHCHWQCHYRMRFGWNISIDDSVVLLVRSLYLLSKWHPFCTVVSSKSQFISASLFSGRSRLSLISEYSLDYKIYTGKKYWSISLSIIIEHFHHGI